MIDPGALERDQGLQQVPAPAFEQVQREPPSSAQGLCERLVAGALQDQGSAASDLDRPIDQAYQAGTVQLGQHLGLGGQPPGSSVVDGDLEDADALGALLDG